MQCHCTTAVQGTPTGRRAGQRTRRPGAACVRAVVALSRTTAMQASLIGRKDGQQARKTSVVVSTSSAAPSQSQVTCMIAELTSSSGRPSGPRIRCLGVVETRKSHAWVTCVRLESMQECWRKPAPRPQLLQLQWRKVSRRPQPWLPLWRRQTGRKIPLQLPL